MTIPPYLYPLAAPLLIPVARQLGRQLMSVMNGSRSLQSSEPDLPSIPEQVKKDPRYVGALVEYSQRKEIRLEEFHSLEVTQAERRLQIRQQEICDRKEISRLQRELIRELQANEIQLKLHELDAIWNREKWFSNLSRQETERILLEGQEQHRLLMFMAPPDISEDCPQPMQRHLKKDIGNGLRRFLNEHYPQNSQKRPVEFYADYFTRPLGDIEVRKLQMVLSPVPTFILYSDINDYEVHFHVGFWGLHNQNVSLIPIQPWNWEKALEELTKQGLSQPIAIRQVRQLIVTIHQLLATFLVDWYYLSIDPHYQPYLYKLNSEFPRMWVKPYLAVLEDLQQQRRNIYRQELQIIVKQDREQQQIKTKQNPQNWSAVLTLTGHSDVVNVIAVSPDGQFIVSGGWDNNIKIWSVETGQLLRTCIGHSNSITALTITPDAQQIVSGSVDSTVKVWSVQTGQLLYTLSDHSYSVSAIAVSPDFQFIVSGSWDNTIKIWSLATGELLRTLTGHTNSVNAITIDADSELVYSGSIDNSTKVWSIKTGKLEHTFEPFQSYKTVKISSDARFMVSGSWDNTIEVWSLKDGQLVYTLPGHDQELLDLAVSPNSQFIASGSSDQTIKIWSLETGYLLRTLSGHFNSVNTLSFSSDGLFLASGSNNGVIMVWRCH
ncbi:MAG: WD40 repeat domain-containing protein [Cyanobacteria bacterium J06592_8]